MEKYNLNSEVITTIEKIRDRLKLDQKSFASLFRLTPSAYTRIKNGETNLTLNFIQEVSEQTKTSLSEILNVSGSQVYNNENNKGIMQNGNNQSLNINLSKEQFEDLKDIFAKNE